MHSLLAFLSRPIARRLAVALGALLATPSLTTGLCADDWLQVIILRGLRPFPGLPESRLDLFWFAGRAPGQVSALADAGRPAVVVRPQREARLLAAVERAHPPARSGALALLAGGDARAQPRLVRAGAGGGGRGLRALPARLAAGLAALLYAVDGAHALPAGWLANRSALLAVALDLLKAMLAK